MDNKQNQIPEIYHSARELHGEERARFLEEACGSDADMRRQIQLLLHEDETANSLLDRPAIGMAGELILGSKTPTWMPGTQIGPYQLLSLVGAGGMGAVYRARDTRLDRKVALKLVHSHLLVDTSMRRRVRSEARAVAGLSHRNIVALFDIGEFQGTDFLVMEYVEGRTLKDVITSGSLSLRDVVHYGTQIASALSAAHAAGIVHRDIKPANVIITPQSELKVLDFGLAKPAVPAGDHDAAPSQQATAPGMIVGTVSYMSPEQTQGKVLDARSDIFSLGCVLYEMATGCPPFQGPSTLAIMHEIATVYPPAPSSINVKLPAVFDRLIQRALAKNREDRFGSALQLAEELRAFEHQTNFIGFARRPRTLFGLNLRWVAIAVIAILAIVTGVGSAPMVPSRGCRDGCGSPIRRSER